MTCITLRWGHRKMCLLGICGGECVDESRNSWISLSQEGSVSAKSCSFLSNPIKKTWCNLAYYFFCIKYPFERCSFIAAYPTNFRRNSSVLCNTTRKRASPDSTKIRVLVHPRGSCLQHNTKKPQYSVSIKWNSVTLTETTVIVQRENIYHSRCDIFQSLVISSFLIQRY